MTLFDRIALIDTRFEVLKRDAEVAILRALREPGADLKAVDQAHRQRLWEIQEDREFLRLCNIGGEAMSPENQDRVRAMATKYRWTNPRGEEVDFLTADEIENLTIRSGTLTAAERQIINHHIDVTIQMLEALPWPRHLQNIPEYAGGHHERMDGKGYPRGLTRDQMSVQARIMGIADIFEALTARDRPYKPGMTLSQALDILDKFRHNGHIDPDLHDVFIGSQIYRKYAAEFLDAKQVDC